MIDISSELLDSYKSSPQFENMWDFYMEDWAESNFNISKLKVISTSLPFVSFENGTHISGNTYYTGYKMPDTFSITFREDSDFSITNYFKKWEAEIFDIYTGCFISSEKQKTRNGVFVYSKFKLNLKKDQVLSLMKINKARGRSELDFSKQFKLQDTRVFELKAIRYLGISDHEASYTSGKELKVTVNFTVDTVLDDYEIDHLYDHNYDNEKSIEKIKRRSDYGTFKTLY